MQPREKMLAAVVAALVTLMGAYYGYTQVGSWFDTRHRRIQSFNDEIAQKDLTINRGVRDQKRLAEWEAKSLPSNLDEARTIYRHWLAEMAEQVGLERANVEAGRPTTLTAYSKLPFTVRGQGTLDQVVGFLYDFHLKEQLHQIRSVSLTPITNDRSNGPRGRMEIVISIEALALPGAEPSKSLAGESPTALAGREIDEYRRPILNRDFFAAYVPPPPPQAPRAPPPAPAPFDAARFAMFSGFTEVNDRPQVWLNMRTTGQVLRLSEGDEFTIGDLRIKVVRIDDREVEIETADGAKSLVAFGKSLRDGQPVPSQ